MWPRRSPYSTDVLELYLVRDLDGVRNSRSEQLPPFDSENFYNIMFNTLSYAEGATTGTH